MASETSILGMAPVHNHMRMSAQCDGWLKDAYIYILSLFSVAPCNFVFHLLQDMGFSLFD